MTNDGILPHKSFWFYYIIDYAQENTPEESLHGKLKLEKLNAKVRGKLREENLYEEWGLLRNYRGPTDPGLSNMLYKYKQLDLLELEELANQSVKYSLTKKGKRFKEGFEKFISKVNPNFKKTKDSIDEMLSENIHMSGNELVKTQEISELKKEILGKKLS